MAKKVRNVGASVRARLLQLAKASGQSFELVLTRFDALTPAFAADEQKRRQWHAFVENVANNPGDLADVIKEIAEFLRPHAAAAARLRK